MLCCFLNLAILLFVPCPTSRIIVSVILLGHSSEFLLDNFHLFSKQVANLYTTTKRSYGVVFSRGKVGEAVLEPCTEEYPAVPFVARVQPYAEIEWLNVSIRSDSNVQCIAPSAVA